MIILYSFYKQIHWMTFSFIPNFYFLEKNKLLEFKDTTIYKNIKKNHMKLGYKSVYIYLIKTRH